MNALDLLLVFNDIMVGLYVPVVFFFSCKLLIFIKKYSPLYLASKVVRFTKQKKKKDSENFAILLKFLKTHVDTHIACFFVIKCLKWIRRISNRWLRIKRRRAW